MGMVVATAQLGNGVEDVRFLEERVYHSNRGVVVVSAPLVQVRDCTASLSHA